MAWHFVERKNINQKKWDQIVQGFAGGIPYSYSWYLDIVSSQWEALILNDYEAICALPFNRKKFGFRQLYRPFYVQQLGWIESNAMSSKNISALLDKISARYFFIHYAFHEKNTQHLKNSAQFSLKPNNILDLSGDYINIYKSYARGLKYSLKKAAKLDLKIVQSVDTPQLIHLFKSQLGGKISAFGSKQYQTMAKLIDTCIQNNQGQLWEVQSSSEHLLSMAFFLRNPKRIINLFQVSTQEGRKAHAISFLFDHLIQQNACKNLVFDFEGSEIESVRNFMKSFGAKDRPYVVLNKKWV
jgi:hypothetical protein